MFYRMAGVEVNNRDSGRLKKIRTMDCCCGCGRKAPSQAAHSNFSAHGKARGLKADDKYTIPMAHECHGKFDQYNMGMNREQSLEWFMQKLHDTNRLLKWNERRLMENGVDF